MIEQMFPQLPMDAKSHQQPSDHSAASSGSLDTNYSTAIATTNDTSVPNNQSIRTLCGFTGSSNPSSSATTSSPPYPISQQHHQQPLSSTTSNIPHSSQPSGGNIAGSHNNNTNNNCNISATLLSHHHHHHHLHGHGPSSQHQHHSHHQHQQPIGTLMSNNHPLHPPHPHHLHIHHHINNRMPPPPPSTSATAAAAVLAALCGSCCGPISDRYIMRVVDAFYHENCLQCTSCSVHLMHSCFARNGKLYCRVDYERLFLKNRCLGCGDRIGSDELVMRTADNVFHLKCFSCVVCGVQLQKGEQYVVKQSQLFCRSDYEKEVEMLQGFNDFVDDYFPEDVFPSKVDGRRGPKRPRTILNTQQRRAFKASFDVSPKPCRKVRETLAKETGLSLRIVQVWFQNQRAKVKKIQKKARQDHHRHVANKSCSETESLGESSLENETKIKDENESDSESYIHGNLDLDHKSIIKEEQENDEDCYKKAMSMGYKELEHHMVAAGLGAGIAGVGDGVGGILGAGVPNAAGMQHLGTFMGLTYSAFQQLMAAPSHQASIDVGGGMGIATSLPAAAAHILNPIDRLYSMQNAYFRCDDEAKFHHEMGN